MTFPLSAHLTELDCLILTQSIHLVDALETVDHVYTITSLGGFEALLRGKEVTVLGKPFYESLCKTKKNRLITFYYATYIVKKITVLHWHEF